MTALSVSNAVRVPPVPARRMRAKTEELRPATAVPAFIPSMMIHPLAASATFFEPRTACIHHKIPSHARRTRDSLGVCHQNPPFAKRLRRDSQISSFVARPSPPRLRAQPSGRARTTARVALCAVTLARAARASECSSRENRSAKQSRTGTIRKMVDAVTGVRRGSADHTRNRTCHVCSSREISIALDRT